MRRLPRLLASYGSYHRDPRNRRTHYAGVPLIIYAVLIAAALPILTIYGLAIRPDRLLVFCLVAGYLSLDLRLGLVLAVLLTLLAWAAEVTAACGLVPSLCIAGVVFLVGWALQLFGHYLEGNRPALVNNLSQTVVSPLYLVAELAFALGWRQPLRTEVEAGLNALPR